VGSAAILAAVSGILPETLRVHGLAFDIGVLPRRGFGKMPNPAAKMAALPKEKEQRVKDSKGSINVSGESPIVR
jgi:hypothetical protein